MHLTSRQWPRGTSVRAACRQRLGREAYAEGAATTGAIGAPLAEEVFALGERCGEDVGCPAFRWRVGEVLDPLLEPGFMVFELVSEAVRDLQA